jgi:hypothetical protein
MTAAPAPYWAQRESLVRGGSAGRDRAYTAGMRRGRWAGIAATLAIGAVAAISAGCGGGTGSALALDPVAAAATKTQDAGAARIRFALAFSAPQLHGGEMLRLRGTGAIDGTNAELTFSGLPSGGSMREIVLQQDGDYVLYLQLSSVSAQLPGGKHWIELDVSKLGKAAGIDPGKLLSGSQLQPGDLLSMLKAEGGKVQSLGSATVDGVAATHYRVTIDMAKALQAKGLTSPLLAGVAAKLPMVPEDVWIGNDGLVRRVTVSFGLTQSSTPLQMGMTMDLYDYGAQVTIAPPPSGDVYDATQLAQQGMAGVSG